jgi:TolB protein
MAARGPRTTVDGPDPGQLLRSGRRRLARTGEIAAAAAVVAFAIASCNGSGRSTNPSTSLRSSRTVSAPAFAVSYRIPGAWTTTPHHDAFQGGAEDGASGFVVINAAGSAGESLQSVCTAQATANVLHPYGTNPRVQTTTISGRAGCYIWPSADAPAQSWRQGGPEFPSAAALIAYLHPISNSGTFQYLLITSDPNHIQAIAGSVRFEANH